MDYNYKIIHINTKDRWIFIYDDDTSMCDDEDGFVELVKRIQEYTNGKIESVGYIYDTGLLEIGIISSISGILYLV